jgi:hypothetical protein
MVADPEKTTKVLRDLQPAKSKAASEGFKRQPTRQTENN